MTSTSLKILAIVTMLIDHVGAVLFPEIWVLRLIGRLAFPIFCFLIIEGYFHTSNVKKYISRLFVFGLIAEIPFDLTFHSELIEFSYQNVFFTLALGLLAVYLFDQKLMSTVHIFGSLIIGAICIIIKIAPSSSFNMGFYGIVALISVLLIIVAYTFKSVRNKWIDYIGVFMIGFLATAFTSDYFFLGILVIFLVYLAHDDFKALSINLAITSGVLAIMPVVEQMQSGAFNIQAYTQSFMILALIPIYFYNGKKGKSIKYLFYVFYPLHLLIIYFIDTLL